MDVLRVVVLVVVERLVKSLFFRLNHFNIMMRLSTLCYLQKDKQTLMLHRVKKKNDIHQDKWNGVGGKMEIGEMPEECACREIKEETGLQNGLLSFRGVITFPHFADGDDWYVFIFIGTDFKGQLINSLEGNLKWIDNENLLKLNLWEGDKVFLPWILDKKPFFSAKFCYEGKKFIDYEVIFY